MLSIHLILSEAKYADPSRIRENGDYDTIRSYHFYGAPVIVTDIKLARLRCVNHVQRMNSNGMTKGII